MFIIMLIKEMRWFFLKHSSSVNIFGIFIRDSNKKFSFKNFKNSFAWYEKSAVLLFFYIFLQKNVQFLNSWTNKKIFFVLTEKHEFFESITALHVFLRICLIFYFNCILICFRFLVVEAGRLFMPIYFCSFLMYF